MHCPGAWEALGREAPINVTGNRVCPVIEPGGMGDVGEHW